MKSLREILAENQCAIAMDDQKSILLVSKSLEDSWYCHRWIKSVWHAAKIQLIDLSKLELESPILISSQETIAWDLGFKYWMSVPVFANFAFLNLWQLENFTASAQRESEIIKDKIHKILMGGDEVDAVNESGKDIIRLIATFGMFAPDYYFFALDRNGRDADNYYSGIGVTNFNVYSETYTQFLFGEAWEILQKLGFKNWKWNGELVTLKTEI